MFIFYILLFVLVLSLIVLIHEFGHFYFARRANVLCHEFSIGMGPVIYQKRKGEIVYSIRALPLGGYVAMAGEEMSDAYVKKGQTVGLRFNKDNIITDIVLDNELKYDAIGIVQDFELYGKDFSELSITLDVAGEITKYEVLRDAKYRFKGDKPMWITPAERSFETKTLWERFLIIIAGPFANFILAFLLLFMVGLVIGGPNKAAIVGKASNSIVVNKGDTISHVEGIAVNTYEELQTEIEKAKDNKVNITVDGNDLILDLQVYLQGLGIVGSYGSFTDPNSNSHKLIVGAIGGRSEKLKVGDEITGIYMSAEKVEGTISYEAMSTWHELITYATDNGNKQYVYVEFNRIDASDMVIKMTDSYIGISENAAHKLGAELVQYGTGFEQARKFSIIYPFTYPFKQIGSDVKQMLATLGLLFNPSEKVGVGDLSGPVGIYSLVKNAFNSGFTNFIVFVAFLSVNIGLLNLLPIPALDGGRLVFIGYEAITRKPVNKKVENIIINITFLMLLGLIIFVTFNDILRLFK